MAVLVGKNNTDDFFKGDTIPGSGEESYDFSGLGGNDTLIGSFADDTLNGGTGRDTLVGNGGNDDLIGGRDFDTDEFVFGPDDGTDSVFQFTSADVIVLRGASNSTIAGILDDVGENTDGAVLTYGDTRITLVGVDPADVSADFFATA